MNFYSPLGPLGARLAAWHDATVAHERRLRFGTSDRCDEDCPHAEARSLWSEAVAVLGPRAHELTFLRSRATGQSARARLSPRRALAETSGSSHATSTP